MSRRIFLNFAVQDVARTRALFETMGVKINEAYSNPDVAFFTLEDNIFLLFHSHQSFAQHARNPIADAKTANEVITAIAVPQRADVDTWLERAVSAGATVAGEPGDMGYMYKRSFLDLDGHVWEVLWMDPAAIAGADV